MSKTLYTALTALSLIATPTIAAAATASAAPASASGSTQALAGRTPIATPLTRSGTDTAGSDSELAGGGFIIAALAALAVGVGIYIAADSDDSANSP